MRPMTTILIVAALIAAGGAVITANKVVQHRAAEAAARQASALRDVAVLVAARDLPQGHILRDGDLRWDHWPAGVADTTQVILRKNANDTPLVGLVGSATRRPFITGEPVNSVALFVPGGANGFMPGMIAPGKKAVGITVSAASTASGFVLPGDVVDVILTIDLRKAEVNLPGGGRYASETILHNVRILAVDQALNQVSPNAQKNHRPKQPDPPPASSSDNASLPEEQAIVGKTVAIEATAEEAERVLAAQAAGALSLALRSFAYTDKQDGDQAPYTRDVDMSRVLRMATGGGVKIIKGGEIAR